MLYTQEDVKSLSRVGITLQDALQMGLSIRNPDDIKREVLENRAFTGFPALTLQEECQLGELRLENQKGGRLEGVDLYRDERTHLSDHYDGADETPVKAEFLQDGDTISLGGDITILFSRNGKTKLLKGLYSTIIIGIGKNGSQYALIIPNRA